MRPLASRRVRLVPSARIERCIRVLRGHRVILDGDLAGLYEVDIKALNRP